MSKYRRSKSDQRCYKWYQSLLSRFYGRVWTKGLCIWGMWAQSGYIELHIKTLDTQTCPRVEVLAWS
jgi:hypothetical protein